MEAFCGYIYGQFPPGKMVNFSIAGQFFLNMLKAHTQAYKTIKELPGQLKICYSGCEQPLELLKIKFKNLLRHCKLEQGCN